MYRYTPETAFVETQRSSEAQVLSSPKCVRGSSSQVKLKKAPGGCPGDPMCSSLNRSPNSHFKGECPYSKYKHSRAHSFAKLKIDPRSSKSISLPLAISYFHFMKR